MTQVTTFYRGWTIVSVNYSFTQTVYASKGGGTAMLKGRSRQALHRQIDTLLDGSDRHPLKPTGDGHRDRLVEARINLGRFVV